MDDVKDIKIEPITESIWIRPHRMFYTQSGVEKTWDISLGRPSVFVVAFNTDTKKLILVKQLRPALLASALKNIAKEGQTFGDVSGLDVGEQGVTIEFCAGIIDKSDTTSHRIAQSEMWEECGYEVPLQNLQEIQTFPANVGCVSEPITMFYAEVTSAMRKGAGGGLVCEGEQIEVIEVTVEEVKEVLSKSHVQSPPWTLYGMMWFLYQKLPTIS